MALYGFCQYRYAAQQLLSSNLPAFSVFFSFYIWYTHIDKSSLNFSQFFFFFLGGGQGGGLHITAPQLHTVFHNFTHCLNFTSCFTTSHTALKLHVPVQNWDNNCLLFTIILQAANLWGFHASQIWKQNPKFYGQFEYIFINVAHRKLHWRNPKLKSFNLMPVLGALAVYHGPHLKPICPLWMEL